MLNRIFCWLSQVKGEENDLESDQDDEPENGKLFNFNSLNQQNCSFFPCELLNGLFSRCKSFDNNSWGFGFVYFR